jgi:homoserine kinase
LVVVGTHAQQVVARKVPIPALSVVVVLPDIQRTTSAMRQLLPAQVSHADAVFNLSRTALTIEALRSADYDLLRWAMDDKLHQPYRSKLIPGYDAVRQAALEAGAAAVTLSGAGPSMVAFAPSNLPEIGAAMQAAFLTLQTESRSFILGLDETGTQVTDLS